MPGSRRLALAFAAGAPLLAPACIAPSVVDSAGRAAPVDRVAHAWIPASPADLDGLFESHAIEGEAAASLGRVSYHFTRDGEKASGWFTGAALVIGGERPSFQTLEGEWRLVEGLLSFSDGAEARAFVSGDFLKLATGPDAVILSRVEVQ